MNQPRKIILKIFFFNVLYLTVGLKCNVDISQNMMDCSSKELISSRILLNLNEIQKIKMINFSNNSIVEVESLDMFSNLQSLNFQLNDIKNVSRTTFEPLTKLSEIDLSFNSIEYLDPSTFENNRQLKKLSLQGNFIVIASEKPIIRSPSLEILNIGTCGLKKLTKENFLHLQSLTNLDLSSNDLSTLSPVIFSPLTQLSTINLRSNRFYCNCDLSILLMWAKSKQTDMSTAEPVYCRLSKNVGRTQFENIEKSLNCTHFNTLMSTYLESDSERIYSELRDGLFISYQIQPSDGQISLTYMEVISRRLYTIQSLLSLIVFVLVIMTVILIYRRNRTVRDMSDSISDYSVCDHTPDKMSTQLIKNSKDYVYISVK